jgi:hypothetical protein
MGVAIFGAVFWGLAYVALSRLLDTKTLHSMFIVGVLSIPAIVLVKGGVMVLFQRMYPVRMEKLYERGLQENAVMKVLFIISFYHLVAKQSANPVLTLVVAAVLFTLAIPEHLFRFWTYKEAPDRYNMFILDQSSLLHRLVMVALALLFQILCVKFM